MRSVRTSDQEAQSAGWMEILALEKSRTLICDDTCDGTSGRMERYISLLSLTRPSAVKTTVYNA